MLQWIAFTASKKKNYRSLSEGFITQPISHIRLFVRPLRVFYSTTRSIRKL